MLYRYLMTLAFLVFSIESFGTECLNMGKGVVLQVLGSGGPELYRERASTSYLIWLDGRARVLIDIGGGSASRFGEAGAQIEDLYVILLSHLHVDHTSDLPAIIKSTYFTARNSKLPIFGPTGSEQFPSTEQFILKLFGNGGAYRYLSDFMRPNQDEFWIEPHNVSSSTLVKKVFSNDELVVRAIEVLHGSVPSLAWRIDAGGKSIVFSGDTSGDGGNLEKLAMDADLFVAHNAVPEFTQGIARKLHMPPSVIGRIGAKSKVGKIVLSHRMKRTLGKESQTLAEIKKSFKGSIFFADDLDCFDI